MNEELEAWSALWVRMWGEQGRTSVLTSTAQRSSGLGADGPYHLIHLDDGDADGPDWASSAAPLDGLTLTRHSGFDWAPGEVDGIFVTTAWLERRATPDQLALLALTSLSVPLWWVWSAPEELDRQLPLGPLCAPLRRAGPLGAFERARLFERLAAGRHVARWLEAMDAGGSLHHVYSHLADLVVSPESGLIGHVGMQFRVASEVGWAQSERSVLSCLAFELRWPNGRGADLPAESAMAIDALVRGSLRDTDVVGKLDDHVYLAILPGQLPTEAMVPAQRILGLDLNAVLPAGVPPLRVALALSGRDVPPQDGLSLVLEADQILRSVEADGEVHTRETSLKPPLTAAAPVEDAVLRPRARLIDALPGLFRSPISDRKLEQVLRVLTQVLPSFDLDRGLRMARLADVLANLVGGCGPHGRRILWRASLLQGLGRVAGVHGSRNSLVEPYWRLYESCTALKLEATVLVDAQRHLFGASSSRLRRGTLLYKLARIIEVVDAFIRLGLEDGQGMGGAPAGRSMSIAEIRDTLRSGSSWRYEEDVLGAFLEWLAVHGEQELAR